MNENEITTVFNNKIAKEIASKNFAHTLDCILGYSDSGYSLSDSVINFEQNFSEDLEERGCMVNERRLKIISNFYEKEVVKFQSMVRKKYKY